MIMGLVPVRFRRFLRVSLSGFTIASVFSFAGFWIGYRLQAEGVKLAYEEGERDTVQLHMAVIQQYTELRERVSGSRRSACRGAELRGTYLAEYRAIEREVKKLYSFPHNNPCSLGGNRPAMLELTFSNSWNSWSEFMQDEAPVMTFTMGEHTVAYGIDDEWKAALISWRDSLYKQQGLFCSPWMPCTIDRKTGVIDMSYMLDRRLIPAFYPKDSQEEGVKEELNFN